MWLVRLKCQTGLPSEACSQNIGRAIRLKKQQAGVSLWNISVKVWPAPAATQEVTELTYKHPRYHDAERSHRALCDFWGSEVLTSHEVVTFHGRQRSEEEEEEGESETCVSLIGTQVSHSGFHPASTKSRPSALSDWLRASWLSLLSWKHNMFLWTAETPRHTTWDFDSDQRWPWWCLLGFLDLWRFTGGGVIISYWSLLITDCWSRTVMQTGRSRQTWKHRLSV